MRATFVKTLEKLADKNKDIFLLTADLGKFFNDFKERYPDRFINVGVAEENMIGIATGLALFGKNVYCYSITPFLLLRPLEHIRVNICFENLNVKFLGAGGGLVYAKEGFTHQAIEDIAVMRALPNMTVVCPADLLEAEALAKESVNYKGPLYIRFGKDNSPPIHQTIPKIEIGKGIVLNRGKDIAIIATGSMVYNAKLVTGELIKHGIRPTLIDMHTIKPLDKDLIGKCARSNKLIFTIEEHSEINGLGTAVAEVLLKSGYRGLFEKIALPDKYISDVGSWEYLLKKYKLDAKGILNHILNKVEK